MQARTPRILAASPSSPSSPAASPSSPAAATWRATHHSQHTTARSHKRARRRARWRAVKAASQARLPAPAGPPWARGAEGTPAIHLRTVCARWGVGNSKRIVMNACQRRQSSSHGGASCFDRHLLFAIITQLYEGYCYRIKAHWKALLAGYKLYSWYPAIEAT